VCGFVMTIIVLVVQSPLVSTNTMRINVISLCNYSTVEMRAMLVPRISAENSITVLSSQ